MSTFFTLQVWVFNALNTLAGWDHFNEQINLFFNEGASGAFEPIGYGLMILGFIGAGISFAVHKFNPQSRMPGWFSLLLVGLFGMFVSRGIQDVEKIFDAVRKFIWSLFFKNTGP